MENTVIKELTYLMYTALLLILHKRTSGAGGDTCVLPGLFAVNCFLSDQAFKLTEEACRARPGKSGCIVVRHRWYAMVNLKVVLINGNPLLPLLLQPILWSFSGRFG